jgi:hypothetical protein
VVPAEVKQQVLAQLVRAEVPFDAAADLCEMSAKKDPALQRWAQQDGLTIAACYPRAVKWLFAAAGAPLAAERVEVLNMRVQDADQVCARLLPISGPSEGESA